MSNNDNFLNGIEGLKSRVADNWEEMTSQELALSIIAIRLDELALSFDTENGAEDPYLRNIDH